MNTNNKIQDYFFGYLVENPTDMLAFLSCFLPIIFCFLYFKSCWGNYRLLFYYALTILFFDLLSSYFAAYSKNNHIINLTFLICETFFLIKFFHDSINKNWFKYFFIVVGLFTSLVVLLNIFDGTHLVNNYSISIQSICFISISLISYYWILSNSVNIRLGKSVLFWITSGTFIYFSGVFFVYMFISVLLNNQNKSIGDLFIIANIFIVIYRIFLAIGISQTKHILKPIK